MIAGHAEDDRSLDASLPVAWHQLAARTPTSRLMGCIGAGSVGFAALQSQPSSWTFVRLIFLVIGAFGLVGTLMRAQMQARSEGGRTTWRRLRAVADVFAAGAALAAGLALLAMLFGGSIGVMRT